MHEFLIFKFILQQRDWRTFFTVLNVGSRDVLSREIPISIKIRTSSCLLMLHGGIVLTKAVLNCWSQSF